MRNKFIKLYDANHPVYLHYTYRNNVNYAGQKSMAKKRNVDWQFDFYTWIEWWVNTGHFHERGVGNNNYQMCRINDVGPYSITNVYCDTGKNNKKDSIDSIIPIIMIDPLTGNETYYESLYACSKDTNLSSGNISKCVKGTRKTLKGYKFKYAN